MHSDYTDFSCVALNKVLEKESTCVVLKFYRDLFNLAQYSIDINAAEGKFYLFCSHYNFSVGRNVGAALTSQEQEELKEIRILALCFAQAVWDSEKKSGN